MKNIKKILKNLFNTFYFGLYNSFIIGVLMVIFSCLISKRLPKSIKIPHPIGIIIGKGSFIGENCVIMQNVSLGIENLGDKKSPAIGNNVFIGSGATIIGDIFIGDNVTIGSNTFVNKSIPANSIVYNKFNIHISNKNDITNSIS